MGYADSFGLQWQVYQRTQLDSYTGVPVSRERLERCVGAPVESLAGRTVLEVGCGAGRFTEWLLRGGARLTSLDASAAVTANRKNCARLGPYRLIQSDINASPLHEGVFDVVLCLGVIQHTPSPETTIASLARHLTPGGLLVIDHYGPRSLIDTYLTLRYPLRAVLRRLARSHPDTALRITRGLVSLCDPIRRVTCRSWLDRIVGRLLPTACYYAIYPTIAPAIIREWNELDTHDALTDWFKHRRTLEQIRTALEAARLTAIECWYGGNGIEARARR